MISFRVILLFSLILFNADSYCQIDAHKLDSLSSTIDSSAYHHRKWQDSFTKVQDSLYQTSVAGKDSTLLNDHKIAAEKRQESHVRIILGVLFGIAVITGFLMRKKPTS